MAELDAAERKALPKSDFVFPDRAPGPGSYPVPDEVRRAVHERYPDIEIEGAE
jgi:hypothetical protein